MKAASVSSLTPSPAGAIGETKPRMYAAVKTAMYEEISPGAEPSRPRTNNWKASPYRSHESVLASAAVQMLVAGTEGGAISFPIRLPTHTATGGRNLGALSRTTTNIR